MDTKFPAVIFRSLYSIFGKWLGVELSEVSTIEKVVAAVGGGLAIFVLVGLSFQALPGAAATSVVASMGASAVLLFGVPHGQLSQPWPVIAGHGISAVIGVACAKYIDQPQVAVACAVGLAIGVMHQLKCIHPPGGATAFTAVMGGDAIHSLGFEFALFPVLTNAVAMVLLAVLVNSLFQWRRYPAFLNKMAHPPPPGSTGNTPVPTHPEVVAALKSLDSFVDVTEEDLLRLAQMLFHHIPSRQTEHDKRGPDHARTSRAQAAQTGSALTLHATLHVFPLVPKASARERQKRKKAGGHVGL